MDLERLRQLRQRPVSTNAASATSAFNAAVCCLRFPRFIVVSPSFRSPHHLIQLSEFRGPLHWLTDSGDGINRHFDSSSRPQDRPISDPPPTLPEGTRRNIDVASLVTEVVVSPFAPIGRLSEVRALLAATGVVANVRKSALTSYSSLLPTDEELKRFNP